MTDLAPGLREFVDLLRRDPVFVSPPGAVGPIVVARAPGRLDVMGGISDYSGGLVLQWPILEAAFAAARLVDESAAVVSVSSLPEDDASPARTFSIPADELLSLADSGYDVARARFAREADDHWAAYLAGVLVVLAREKGVRLAGGLRLLLRSEVPEGKGVSSSAAIEVASMRAVAGALGVEIDGVELAKLCQKVENLVVGAPCGLMDQMTSAVGRQDQLLALLCQPARILGFVHPPDSLRFWGIDSGLRHAVTGADYSGVRTAAFMGYRVLAHHLGLPGAPGPDGVVSVDDSRWHGYLANIDAQEFDRHLAPLLPDSIVGDEFLRCYGGTTDPVTRVDPARSYRLVEPTRHPVLEHARVRRFADLLEHARDADDLAALGRLMYESHESYSACGLGSDGTDRLVELVREAGPASGLYGAKITGGGSGGTVAILGGAGAGPAVHEVADRYARETGREARVFSGSSPGACEVDLLRLPA